MVDSAGDEGQISPSMIGVWGLLVEFVPLSLAERGPTVFLKMRSFHLHCKTPCVYFKIVGGGRITILPKDQFAAPSAGAEPPSQPAGTVGHVAKKKGDIRLHQ